MRFLIAGGCLLLAASVVQGSRLGTPGGGSGGVCSNFKKPKLDILYVVDNTVSMKYQILSDAKGSIEKFSAYVTSNFDDVKIGLIEFNDKVSACTEDNFNTNNNYCARMTTPLTDVATGLDAVRAVKAEQGGQPSPEDLMAALAIATTSPEVGWRDDAVRVLMVFTDAAYRIPTAEFCGTEHNGNCEHEQQWYDPFGCWRNHGMTPFAKPAGDYTYDCHKEDYISDQVIIEKLQGKEFTTVVFTTPEQYDTYEAFTEQVGDRAVTIAVCGNADFFPGRMINGLRHSVRQYVIDNCNQDVNYVRLSDDL